MPAIVILAVLIASVTPSESPRNRAGVERELTLRPGAFAGFDGTALDKAVTFVNDIYDVQCYPLFAVEGWSETAAGKTQTGRILAWLGRAHVTGGRVFVQTCEPLTSTDPAPLGKMTGALSDVWLEATLIDRRTRPHLQLRRIDVPGWNSFSTPEFCGRHVAFWSLAAGGALTAHVVDLFNLKALQSAPFGVIAISGSDNGWGIPVPAWNGECSVATFRHEALIRTISVPRGPRP